MGLVVSVTQMEQQQRLAKTYLPRGISFMAYFLNFCLNHL